YLYLSMLGPALLAAWLIVSYRRRWTLFASAAALIALAVRSNVQLSHWHDDRALWTHTLAVCPDSFNAPTNLAGSYSREATRLGNMAIDAAEAGKREDAAALV